MGGTHSDNESEYFDKSDWQLINMNESSVIWQSRRDPTQKIQQFRLFCSSQEEHNKQKQMYYLRKNHPHLVAAIFLNSQSTSQFCSSSYQQKLYIERIPIRLADIQHIPYPDYLHVYNQSLKGYSQLANHVGFFAVQEEIIGINQHGLVKIWMNPDFSKAQIIGGKISQEAMVRNIIDIIDRNVDQNKSVPSVKNYIYQSNDKIQFEDAIIRFNNYVRQYCNGVIPQKLQCIDRVGGIFAISNRMVSPAKNIIYDQKSNNYQQTNAQNPIYVNQNRPQLIDSAILNSRYQSPISQYQNSGHYQVVSNRFSEGNRSRPNIVIPVNQEKLIDIRQPAATFHNYGSNRPNINSFIQKSPNSNISEGRLQSRVVFVPTPKASPQIQQVKILTQNSPKSPQVQNIFGNRIQQQIVNIKPTNQNTNPNRIVKINSNYNSYAQPQLQPAQTQQSSIQPKLQIKPEKSFNNNESNILNFNIRQKLYQQKYNKSTVQQKPMTSNLAIQPLVFELNSQVTQKTNQFGYNSGVRPVASPKATRQTNQLLVYSNVNSKNVSLDQSPIIKGSSPSYSAVNEKTYNVESLYTNYNTNKNYLHSVQQEKGQFKAVNIDDGKSSSDFFKKLNQLGNLGEKSNFESFKYQTKPYQIIEQKQPLQQIKQDYKNPFKYTDTNKDLISYTQISYTNQFYTNPQSEEQFGRNAVSNIFNNQKGFQANSVNKLVEPLKFQNNLDMKYSIFKNQQYKTPTYAEPTYGSYAYRSYDANFDPDLLADMKNLKE